MRIIDLSMELHPHTQVFSAYPHMAVLSWARHDVQGFAAEVIYLATHTGTHVDAPYHFASDGLHIDEVGLDRLVGEAVLIDLGEKPPLSIISAAELKAHLDKVSIRAGHIVIIKTGWAKMAGRVEYLTMNPGLSSDAAEYLAELGVASVGLDTPNLDQAQAKDYPAHKILLSRGVPIIENLTNLERIGASKFMFIGVPLKIRGASGSPIRAIAITEGNTLLR
jgi:kynurenine formamidase